MKFIFYYLSDLKLKTDAVNLPVKCLLGSQSEAAESPFPINFYKTGHFSAGAAPLLKKIYAGFKPGNYIHLLYCLCMNLLNRSNHSKAHMINFLSSFLCSFFFCLVIAGAPLLSLLFHLISKPVFFLSPILLGSSSCCKGVLPPHYHQMLACGRGLVSILSQILYCSYFVFETL